MNTYSPLNFLNYSYKKKKNLNYSEFVEGIYNKLNPKLIINLPRVTIFAL